ncbi:hypothetical protein Pyn_36417 [Prunus yedoensis var. nudiflora]|uniref:Uncharacterized protein n=1 Tax=Prunus yedoensis var. nudiflora TaxID=2094558 RepID=A0A314Y279_PRUYE|nr:hypothetical protein Pyn_36417 [Prunus yedoensis var. nudiflora]
MAPLNLGSWALRRHWGAWLAIPCLVGCNYDKQMLSLNWWDLLKGEVEVNMVSTEAPNFTVENGFLVRDFQVKPVSGRAEHISVEGGEAELSTYLLR